MGESIRPAKVLPWEELTWPANDFWILALAVVIPLVGMVMIASANMPFTPPESGLINSAIVKQLGIVLVGYATLLTVSLIDYHLIVKHWQGLYALTLCGLLAVLALGLLNETLSARWFEFGGLTFQPSELAKVTLIAALSSFLFANRDRLANFRVFLLSGTVAGLPILLVMIQPDLSTSLTMVVASLAVSFSAGVPVRYIALATVLVLVLVATIFIFRDLDYQLARIAAFLNPEVGLAGANYQAQQSALALGSGGLTGKGIGMGTIKYLYLPVSTSDSIFAVIGEELGLVGTGGVLAAFVLLLVRGLYHAARAPDLLGSALAAGITTSIVAQALLNMLVNTGLVPVTGLPLPLISAGGTSHLFTMAMLGILLNVARSTRLREI